MSPKSGFFNYLLKPKSFGEASNPITLYPWLFSVTNSSTFILATNELKSSGCHSGTSHDQEYVNDCCATESLKV